MRSDVLSPDSSLTNIWKLSEDGDEDVELEEAVDEERDVRMLGDAVGGYGLSMWHKDGCCFTEVGARVTRLVRS